MKRNLIQITRSFTDVLKGNLKKNLSRLSPMISSLNQKWFSEVILKYGYKLVSLSLYSISSKIHSRVQLFHRFGNYLYIMSRRHGVPYTVKYLKACQLAVQKRIANQPLSSLRELEPDLPLPGLSKSGLPRIIRLRDRRAIASGSHSVIRMWLTFFSIYRIIKMPVTAKLKTITDPFIGDASYLREFELMVPSGIHKFQSFFDKKFSPKLGWKSTNGILPIMKAGGGYSVSLAKLLDLPEYLKEAGLWTHLCNFVALSNNQKLYDQITRVEDLSNRANSVFGSSISPTYLGRLSFKEEAAGKLRVFAMVDCLTQSALYGLHEWLFELLRRIPNDGTFNQEAAFARAQVKAAKFGKSFGYDLSSATDRLPLTIQVKILESWFGQEKADLWRTLLVDRDYHVLPGKRTDKYGITPGPYRYAVGQPMGAYSSWAMLAITHHYIVQMAYQKAYPFMSRKWFEGYELLGDDIVIFDELVAKYYLEIMKGLGVEINLSKSVVSNPGSVVEFAKRTSFKGVDVSAVSLKMLQAALDSKSKVQVALYLALKTGRVVSNYFKAIYSLGPSHLYKLPETPSSLVKAESSLIMQLLKPDWTNFPTILKASIKIDGGMIEGDLLSGEPLVIDPKTAHKLVTCLTRGENVLLRSTENQQSAYYDIERALKSSMIERVTQLVKKVYDRFTFDSIYAVELLLSPWLEEDHGEGPTYFVRDMSKGYYITVGGKEIDRYSDEYRDLSEKLYRFVSEVWFNEPLEKGYVDILETLGKMNLYHEHESGNLRTMWERFTGSAADPYYYSDLPLEKLFYLKARVESLLSTPALFVFGWKKIRGIDTPIPKHDPANFVNSIIAEIPPMLKKANKQGKIGYLDTFNNWY